MARVLAIGECMIELTHVDSNTLALGYAGDTFNTAVYLARLTEPAAVRIAYLTRVGDEGYSAAMLAAMTAEGIDTSQIQRTPEAQPGLYLVRTDAAGERSFTYYRAHSPARALFDGTRAIEFAALSECDVCYLSAITLQLLGEAARERLLAELASARARGARIVFDGNYRPAGWPDPDTARAALNAIWPTVSVALPTFDDERELHGDAGPADTVARLRAHGVPEIVVKDGARGALVWTPNGEIEVPAERVAEPVDSTAAGDAFNAGYLAARLTGSAPPEAAAAGHAIAARVIQQPGAILPDTLLPRRSAH
ncbi:2-dehydro-3-deoxygluconokinase [Tamaricihabitans halophyticus]|uniref:2-dehydro-3-deoxygluconokinase n=1 Tax=Tamaricihabitans halophyticus TaxID=1262583 RepID=A0A4R2QIQ3_9PSEU|nr:sugar kinase [Tamaricihabitans halophyticus]TCP46861.1 2-dehydro-3-deoxygluconokinase [Tamaricihabitans halophyticus]